MSAPAVVPLSAAGPRSIAAPKMAVVLLYVVAALQLGGGLYDTLTPTVPPFHQKFLGASHDQLDPRVVELDLALLGGNGGCLLAIGLAMLVLIHGPFRRGEGSATLAILLLVVVAEGGNVVGMYRVGSPWYVPLIIIGLALTALGIATVARRAARP